MALPTPPLARMPPARLGRVGASRVIAVGALRACSLVVPPPPRHPTGRRCRAHGQASSSVRPPGSARGDRVASYLLRRAPSRASGALVGGARVSQASTTEHQAARRPVLGGSGLAAPLNSAHRPLGSGTRVVAPLTPVRCQSDGRVRPGGKRGGPARPPPATGPGGWCQLPPTHPQARAPPASTNPPCHHHGGPKRKTVPVRGGHHPAPAHTV